MMFNLTNKIGKIGEDTACVFLMKRGYVLTERNYWKKWGEIDIVAEKEGITHFVEVKSVNRKKPLVAHETDHRPEENVHWLKQRRLKRVISTFILERKIQEGKWQFDIAAVYLDTETKKAEIAFLENIIL